MEDLQETFWQLLKDFKARYDKDDDWSQGVKDGIRKCMVIVGVEHQGVEYFAAKVDKVLERQARE